MSYKRPSVLLFLLALILSTKAMADWPVAINDTVTVHASQNTIGKVFDVLSNDIGQGLDVIEVNTWSEQGGLVSASTNGVNYIPPRNNFVGEDGFWYVIQDNQGRTNAARVSVTILPTSAALPAPQEDLVTTPRNTQIRINAIKNDIFTPIAPDGGIANSGRIVQFNDWSEKGGRIKITEVYPKPPGQSQTFLSRQFLYTPPADFSGTDTFWYTIKDDLSDQIGSSEQATKVTIEVDKDATIPVPFPMGNPDRVDLECVRTCITSADVLRNDIGSNNLIVRLNSFWSLRGGSVNVGESIGGRDLVNYRAPSGGFAGEDKVWYILEDEFGRQSWSVLTINVTRLPL